MSFNILNIATGHSLMETDDCLNWDCLGLNYFSTGWLRTKNQIGSMPKLKCPMHGLDMSGCRGGTFSSDLSHTPLGIKNKCFAGNNVKLYNIWKFTENFLKNFDFIISSHYPHNIYLNRELIKKLKIPTVIKTFGLQNPSWEKIYEGFRKDGIYIIRNSPEEQSYVKNYAGHDVIIRGSVVVNEKNKWNGRTKKSLFLCSNYSHSGGKRRRNIVENIMENCKWPIELYGAANEGVSYWKGFLEHEEKIKKIKNYRCSLIAGNPNSNNIYSLCEAMCLAVPCVIFNKQLWGGESFEEDLFTHNKDCILISNPNEGAEAIDRLMKDKKFANRISRNAAKLGRRTWGREKICNDWKVFFNSIGLKI